MFTLSCGYYISKLFYDEFSGIDNSHSLGSYVFHLWGNFHSPPALGQEQFYMVALGL